LNRTKVGLVSRLKSRLASHFREVNERDREWMMRFDLGTMQSFLWPLFVAFVCLNFLDVYTTTIAFSFGPLFHEENPIAAALFDGQFRGYLLALVFKYLPMIPLFYLVFVQDGNGEHRLQIRVVKLAALVALAGGDAFLFYIVGINNLHALLFSG
jgi:hypothetical protein